ncbi:MAG TPA: hypothetical protein VKA46_17885 [Gemmataceae bacterium]|nr:hypothetical protein [Gemmataceae bacterium]
MRLFALAACFLTAFGLAGCLSTHHEEFSNSSTLGIGPNGVESTSGGSYTARDWTSPWFAQPDRARP